MISWRMQADGVRNVDGDSRKLLNCCFRRCFYSTVLTLEFPEFLAGIMGEGKTLKRNHGSIFQ